MGNGWYRQLVISVISLAGPCRRREHRRPRRDLRARVILEQSRKDRALPDALGCGRVGPVVAVQVAPGDAPAALEQSMLRACSTALPNARCVSARDSAGEPSSAVAMVSWEGASRARVEVGIREVE